MGSSINILVVDDDKVFRLQMEAILYKLKYHNVTTVATYEEALSYLYLHHVDIIILDIILSTKKSGIDLAEFIKSWGIPILFVSSQEKEDVYLKASKIPFSAYLTKPLHPFTLDNRISSLLHKSQDDIFLHLAFNKGGFIKLTDILYIEVENTYSFIYTAQKKIAYKKSLTQLTKLLPMQYFLQIHRRYLVQKKYIRNLDLYEGIVTLDNELVLPMSRRMKQEIKRTMLHA